MQISVFNYFLLNYIKQAAYHITILYRFNKEIYLNLIINGNISRLVKLNTVCVKKHSVLNKKCVFFKSTFYNFYREDVANHVEKRSAEGIYLFSFYASNIYIHVTNFYVIKNHLNRHQYK
jgi:hypothetical protein